MAWMTEDELYAAVKSAARVNPDLTLPPHWEELVTGALAEGYEFVCAALADRDFSQAQMDTWRARVVWNRTASVYFFFEAAGFGAQEQFIPLLDRLWERLKQLATITLLDADGDVIEPAGGNPNVGWGEYLDDGLDRTIEMDTTL